jgi:hypothetical protein
MSRRLEVADTLDEQRCAINMAPPNAKTTAAGR